MFPIEFDHLLLDNLPVLQEEDVIRVAEILRAIVVRRIVPYFRKSKGSDPIVVARAVDHLTIDRLEDEENRVRIVSFISQKNGEWFIHIQERIFDYLAFVIPKHPESRLGEVTRDETKFLAFAEFVLRHEIERVLYPQRSEKETVHSDVAFAMERRSDDPTFYRGLRNALSDEMTGLNGRPYLDLLDCAEKGKPYDTAISEILNALVPTLADLPEAFIRKAFPLLDTEFKTKVLGLCYRKSRDTNYSLLNRTFSLERVVRLFNLLTDSDQDQAQEVFESFKDRWGLVYLLQELGLSEADIEGKGIKEIFELFKKASKQLAEELDGLFPLVRPAPPQPKAEGKAPAHAAKSLKDRIEDAKKDPRIPVQVMAVIEKNKLNAVGQSGSKYSELIETLLSVPWGRMQKIDVTPEDFEEGLERSHYGLHKPKEILCDFFTNLIWRYEKFSEDNMGWRRNGSAFLFVGPPGVGKTSLAISTAKNLKIPYHKISLGGMRDEADLKGHGFTYEGSKPGAIVQGSSRWER